MSNLILIICYTVQHIIAVFPLMEIELFTLRIAGISFINCYSVHWKNMSFYCFFVKFKVVLLKSLTNIERLSD
jgi:hypothetical protein